jgi:putative GTP pyrophosphokinase
MEKNQTTDFYKGAQVLLESVLQELLLRVDLLRRYQVLSGQRDPVEHCKGRIKSEKSMKEKLQRKGLPVTLEAALNEVHDAVGIRIVCQFVDDVYRMAEMLKKQEDIQIVKEKDFIQNPKPNGYRSYHIIVKIPVHLPEYSRELYAEIQIRTIAMDCWAALEHELKYKQTIPNQELLQKELKRCSDEMASTDLTMQTIRQIIDANENMGKDERMEI